MSKKQTHMEKAFEGFDFEQFKGEVMSRLRSGDRLLGEEGIFRDLLQRFVNAALEGEITEQIKSDNVQGKKNRRNGYTNKVVRSENGPLQISPPRDRNGEFEPQLIKKWDRSLGTGVDEQILYMYSFGNSYNDIQMQLKKIYGVDVSSNVIAEVTQSVSAEIIEWQQRPLLPFYTVLFVDGIYFTTREGNKSNKRVVYSVYAVDANGNRDVLGLYIKPVESATGWGKVMSDLKNRGVKDILFVCIDGLKALSDAIEQEFPNAVIQRCIVHKVRNSVKFVPDKDIKAVCADLRKIYTSADITVAQIALESFKQKWDSKYSEIGKLWEKDWIEVTNFLEFGEDIRRLIYTTNPVEALHRQIRKVTKSKGQWPNDKALLTQIYLILTRGSRAWSRKVFNWTQIARELKETYGERYTQYVE
jgi:putative transposase